MNTKVTTMDVLMKYWDVSRKHSLYITVIFFSWIIGTLLTSIIVPIYYKDFIDRLSSVSNHSPDVISILITIISTILLINLLGWLFYRIANLSTNILFTKISHNIFNNSFPHLIGHSFGFFSNNFTGALVQKFIRYDRSYGRIFDRVSADILTLIIKVIASIIVLYYVKPFISLVFIIWIIVYILLVLFLIKIKSRYDIVAAKNDSIRTGAIADSLSNHSSVQLFTGEDIEKDNIMLANKDFLNSVLSKWNIGEYIEAIQAFILFLIEFIVFYLCIKYWGLGIITIGTFILIQTYMLNIGRSFWGFGRVIRDINESISDAKEMVEILNLKHEIQDTSDAKDLILNKCDIEFKNICFSYSTKSGSDNKVFDNFNLKIKDGEKVAIIGPSGAGKSTLIRTLLRLYEINSGEILINGQDIKSVKQESLRRNITLVPQDPVLFHRTLMENIRYGKNQSSDDEVMACSKLAHCDVFINNLPEKYNTFVGERGIKLSGGERQRVAIARAFLKNSKILILDEATSNLDSHSESIIQDALHKLIIGKTTIIIAHRLSTIKMADRIIVLNENGIAEEGSHAELIKLNGVYSELWKIQSSGFADLTIEEILDKNNE